jgi:hypothetical protein
METLSMLAANDTTNGRTKKTAAFALDSAIPRGCSVSARPRFYGPSRAASSAPMAHTM